MIKIPNIDMWLICLNEDLSVIHYFFNPANVKFATGQPIIEEFYNEADWLVRLKELGITPEPRMRTLVAKLDKPKKRRRGVHSKNASKGQLGYKKEYRGQGK